MNTTFSNVRRGTLSCTMENRFSLHYKIMVLSLCEQRTTYGRLVNQHTESSGRYSCGNQHSHSVALKILESYFSLSLLPVSMYACSGYALLWEINCDEVSTSLSFNKHQHFLIWNKILNQLSMSFGTQVLLEYAENRLKLPSTRKRFRNILILYGHFQGWAKPEILDQIQITKILLN